MGLLELNSLFRVENFTLFSTYLACILRNSSRKVHTTSDWLSWHKPTKPTKSRRFKSTRGTKPTAGQSILPWRCHDLYGLGDGPSRWVRTPKSAEIFVPRLQNLAVRMQKDAKRNYVYEVTIWSYYMKLLYDIYDSEIVIQFVSLFQNLFFRFFALWECIGKCGCSPNVSEVAHKKGV